MIRITKEGCELSQPEIDAAHKMIPAHLVDGVLGYVERRESIGQFLTAVFENDLFDAVARADSESLAGLDGLTKWIYNYATSHCWGSEKKVEDWLAAKGWGEADPSLDGWPLPKKPVDG